MIVFQLMRVPFEAVRNRHAPLANGDLVHDATEKVHVTDHLADGIDDVRQIKIARRDLVQHRCEQKKVLAIDNRDFELRIATLLKFKRRVKPAEPTAENEDTYLIRHNGGNLRQEQPVLAEAVRLETTLETGSRVGCAAVRRRRFLRCDRVQPRSDVDRLAEEIWRALLLLLLMESRGRGPTPRRMDQ